MDNGSIGGFSSSKRILDQTQGKLTKAFEKLSSGKRINSASDDAAGLAIADELNSEASIGSKGIDNAAYAQSALDIAGAAVTQVQNITTRLGELAQQSANGTLSNDQRTALQEEYSQLTDEIDRISSTTQFNGVSLLQGQGFSVPVGDASNPNNSITLQGITVNASSLANQNISNADAAKAAMSAVSDMRDNLSQATSSIGALSQRLSTASSTEQVAVENRRAAESTIRDADVASTVADKTSLQIQLQIGAAMNAHQLDNGQAMLKLLS